MKNRKEYMKWRRRTTIKIMLVKQAVYKEIWRLLQKNATKEEGEQFYSAKDVQSLFSIGHSTYYRWISSGVLTPKVINRRHYYQKEEVLALLKKRGFRSRGGLG